MSTQPTPVADGPAPDAPDPGRVLRAGIEALLFLTEEPIGIPELAEALEQPEETVLAEVEALAADYAAAARGIEIRHSAGGWRMYSAALARPVLERWALAGRTGRLTQAALETLAIIAYKQPISRQAIGDIRGVNPDGAVRSLVARGLVVEVARDPGPGQAVLYGTTGLLLERLGIDDLEELPELTEFLPEPPAPDEPELHALRELRRRLSAAGAASDPEPDDDLLPPPAAPARSDQESDMDQLTDRLDQAARNAVERLRAAVAAGPDERRSSEEPDDG